MTSAQDRTLSLELWPDSCASRETVLGYRCTLATGHAGCHFDGAAGKHFLLPSDADRIYRETFRRGR